MATDLVLRVSAESVILSTPNGQQELAREAGLSGVDALLDQTWHLRDRISRHGANRPSLHAEGLDPAAALGGELGSAVLRGAIGRAVARASSAGGALRLGLVVDDLRLADMPWELMVEPGKSAALALDPAVSVYRLDSESPTVARAAVAFTRILFVHASGSHDEAGTALGVEHERALIVDALQIGGGRIALRSLEEATPEAIEGALLAGGYQILHLSCHAAPGVLILEDSHGRPLPVPAERLAAAMPRDQAVRLVVLAGCSTALSTSTPERPADLLDDRPALAGIARALVGAGVDHVIAMSAAVSDACARVFSANFYSSLASGAGVVASVAAARRAINSLEGAMVGEWATPVVHCRNIPEPAGPVTELPTAPDQPGWRAVIGRRMERRRLHRALSMPSAAAVLYGLPGTGKTALIREMTQGFADDGMVVIFRAGRLSARDVLNSLPTTDGLLVCDDFQMNLTTTGTGTGTGTKIMDREVVESLAAVRARGGRLLLSSSLIVDGLPGTDLIPLGPMSDAETRQLLSTLAAGSHWSHRQLIDDGLRAVGGHPSALIELAAKSGALDAALAEVTANLLRTSGLPEAVTGLTPEIRSLLVHVAVHAAPAPEDALPPLETSGLSGEEARHAGLEHLERLGLIAGDARGHRCPRWVARWLAQTYPAAWKQANLYAGSYLWHAGPDVDRMTSTALEQARRHYRVAGLPRMAAMIANDLLQRHRKAGDTRAEELICRDALRDMAAADEDRPVFELALGEIQLIRGRLPEARKIFQNMLEAGRRLNRPEDIARALHRLGVIALDSGDNMLALDYFQQLESLQSVRRDDAGRATALHLKGKANTSLGHLAAARDDLVEALQIKRRLGDPVLLANTLDALGILHRALGDYDAAIACLTECLKLDDASSNARGEAETLIALAGAYLARNTLGDVDRAAEYARLAIPRAQAAELHRTTAMAWHVLGHVAQTQGRYADAEAYYQHALVVFKDRSDPVNVMMTTGQLSTLAREAGQRDKAMELARQVLSMAGRLNDQLSLTRAQFSLGLMHAQAAREHRDRAGYLVAREHLTEALILAERNNYSTFIEDARNCLSQVARDLAGRL